MAAGDFTAADILQIQDRVESYGLEGNINKDLTVDNEALKFILSRQTARIAPLENRRGATEVEVHWVKDCSRSVTDPCPTSCSFTWDELEADSTTYEVEECISSGFSVSDSKFRNNLINRTEVIAKGIASVDKAIAEDHATKLYLKMSACAGVLAGTDHCDDFTNGVAADDLSNATAVDSTLWNYNIMGHLAKFIKLNRMPSNSFILADQSMYVHYWNAQIEAGEPNNSKARKLNTIPMLFDVFSYDGAFGDSRMTLIDPNSYATVTHIDRETYPDVPKTYGNGANITKFNVRSNNIPGAYYEVDYRTTCETGKEIKHIWEFSLRWDYFCAPTSCDTNNTGIFNFVCGEAATVLS